MKKEYTGWIILIIAAFIIAYILAKLVEVWFAKGSNRYGYMFANSSYSNSDDDQRYNQRLFWTSYTAFFLISMFVIPNFFKDLLK